MSDLRERVEACPFCGGRLDTDDLVVWRCGGCHVEIEPGGETAADCVERLNRRSLLGACEKAPGLRDDLVRRLSGYAQYGIEYRWEKALIDTLHEAMKALASRPSPADALREALVEARSQIVHQQELLRRRQYNDIQQLAAHTISVIDAALRGTGEGTNE